MREVTLGALLACAVAGCTGGGSAASSCAIRFTDLTRDQTSTTADVCREWTGASD